MRGCSLWVEFGGHPIALLQAGENGIFQVASLAPAPLLAERDAHKGVFMSPLHVPLREPYPCPYCTLPLLATAKLPP